MGDVVHLDLRHLGEKYLKERLPFICELAKAYVGVDPVKEPIPVRPTAHYTMGGIETNGQCATRLPGLYALGEVCLRRPARRQPSGLQLPSEIVVFGKVAGEHAGEFAKTQAHGDTAALVAKAEALIKQHLSCWMSTAPRTRRISATSWACPWKPASVSTVPKS